MNDVIARTKPNQIRFGINTLIRIDDAKIPAERLQRFKEEFQKLSSSGSYAVMTKTDGIEVITNKKQNHRATFVAVFDATGRYASIGLSECSPKDRFVKKEGVKKARYRAITTPLALIDTDVFAKGEVEKELVAKSWETVKAIKVKEVLHQMCAIYTAKGRYGFWKEANVQYHAPAEIYADLKFV